MKKILLILTVLFYISITSAQTVTTFAGSTSGSVDGTGTAAQFNNPQAVAIDASGNMYVADSNNNLIRKITAAGIVTTFAGSTSGSADGTGTAAQFNSPGGVTIDASGNVYVGDTFNHRIRKITPAGIVTTFAGSTVGSANGTGTAAQFNAPIGIATDASGNVYVADGYNNRIRKITAAGVVTTVAGSTQGFADGTGTAAQFNIPAGIATDGSGNVYVADTNNNRIRKITAAGVVTTVAGTTTGYVDGTGTAASFTTPVAIVTDGSGNMYVADAGNHRIRKITAAGVVTTIAGSTKGFADGTGTAAKFYLPFGLASDATGMLYVADTFNNKIRKITGTSLGLNQNSTVDFDLQIYPNPTSTVLTIELKEVVEQTQLSIVDILGKLILTQKIENVLTTINTSTFSKGVYLLNVKNGTKKATKKFIVE